MGVAGATSPIFRARTRWAGALRPWAALSFAVWAFTPSAAAGNSLRVIPFPGTPDASPASEIIFSTLQPSDLSSVSVRGTISGQHTGRLIPLPAGGGAAFLADHAFAAGEGVQVDARLGSRSAGASVGTGGAQTLRWSFTVAVREPVKAGSDLDSPSSPSQVFRSRPDLHPPLVSVTQDRDLDGGDIFLSPTHDAQEGTMILDARGRLVWFGPRRLPVYNLEVQSYLGKPVLTWWEGYFLGYGQDVIMDQSYRKVAVVTAREGYFSDLHEFQITPQGTALIDIYSPVRANLSSLGGPSLGTATDCIIQELDIRTGRVLWEWHALGHVPLGASYAEVPHDSSPFDYFHINSIQQLPSGNLLISSRSDWAVYEISRRTGNVIWSLGGKHSSFRMGPGTNFEWQHDARLAPDGRLTVFDDAGSPQEEAESSAKTLSLNTRTMTASLVNSITHSPGLLSTQAGSVQTLPNHNVLVGWGSQPVFSEYTPGGQLVFDGRFPYGVNSYRVYRFPWTGDPLTRPVAYVAPGSGGSTVLYASWDGATRVASWRPMGGASPRALRPLGARAPWSGFETVIRRRGRPAYLAVQALDARGRVLGTSEAYALPSGG